MKKKARIFVAIPKKKKVPKTRQIASKAYVDRKLDEAIADRYKDSNLIMVGSRTPTSFDLMANITQGNNTSSQRSGDSLKIKHVACKFEIEQGAIPCTVRVIIFQWRIFNAPNVAVNLIQYPNTENVCESPYNFSESQPRKLYNVLYDRRFTFNSPVTGTSTGDVDTKLGSHFQNKNFVKHINFQPSTPQILKNNLYMYFMSSVSDANPEIDKPVLTGWNRVVYEDA